MEFNYTTIKELAKQTGRKVTDLIALASQNDPFYTGTPNEIALAEWFADIYYSKLSGTKIHVRRMHYLIASLEIDLPNGERYENTEKCWETILLATKAARYLKLVDPDQFADRRNAAPESYSDPYAYDTAININAQLYTSDVNLPDFPDLPGYSLSGYQASQKYHLEIWCEKTTMNDVFSPLCRRYGMTLQTGAGELSITATKALAERIAAYGKPTRILYVSDLDPAGQSMPVAVSRKLEFFIRSEGLEADVRLFPVILTAEQVRAYQLPKIPIKESERRKGAFEEQHGTGATELDALEALYPGELRRLMVSYVERYYDGTLEERSREAREALEEDFLAIQNEILGQYSEEIEERRKELAGIRSDFDPRMEAYSQNLQRLWLAIREKLDEQKLDIADYPLPDPREARELGDGLYNSERDYLDQIDAYKSFQGKQ